MKNNVAVSILGQKNKTKLVNEIISKNFNMIHYDIMDGIFVKNESLNDNQLNDIINNTKKHFINLHLMVVNPVKYIEKYLNKSYFITFHYEATSIENIWQIIKKYKSQTNLGLAINPQTNIEQIYQFVPYLSHILIMSVIPGAGGQKFISNSLNKIKKLRNYIDQHQYNCFIQVDGGINDKTGPKVFAQGVDVVVSGSFIINNLSLPNIKNKILNYK